MRNEITSKAGHVHCIVATLLGIGSAAVGIADRGPLDVPVPVEDAALEAARLRFRPILMTAFAFIMGVVPLVLADLITGANPHALYLGSRTATKLKYLASSESGAGVFINDIAPEQAAELLRRATTTHA